MGFSALVAATEAGFEKSAGVKSAGPRPVTPASPRRSAADVRLTRGVGILAAGSADPVAAALSLVGHPILFSGLSTAGMFASFMPLVFPPIASIGMAYTLSFIFLAFVAVQLFYGLLLVPAALSLIGGKNKKGSVVAEALGPNGPWAKKGALV